MNNIMLLLSYSVFSALIIAVLFFMLSNEIILHESIGSCVIFVVFILLSIFLFVISIFNKGVDFNVLFSVISLEWVIPVFYFDYRRNDYKWYIHDIFKNIWGTIPFIVFILLLCEIMFYI